MNIEIKNKGPNIGDIELLTLPGSDNVAITIYTDKKIMSVQVDPTELYFAAMVLRELIEAKKYE